MKHYYTQFLLNFFDLLKKRKSFIFLILLLLSGVFIRCFLLGVVPPGLNQDEASIGYEAFAIFNYGIDRNGFHNPIHLVSWGSGQNALYAYLSMPFVSLFGLNPFSVRLVNAIFGSISLIVFYLLIKKIFNKQVALISLFFLVINPWHIMMSRWGLESNIFPAIFLLGLYLLILSLDRPYLMLISFFIFAVSLYSYGTSYFVVPVFLLLSSIYLAFHKKIKWKYFIGSITIFILAALPIMIFLIVNTFKLDSIKTPWFTIPLLTATPRYETLSSLFGGNLLAKSYHNIALFFRWFFISQHDGLPWNAIPKYGYMYHLSILFLLLGVGRAIIENRRLRVFNKGFFILIWLFVSLLLAFAVDTNINRINIIFLPMIFLTSYGVVYFKDRVSYVYSSLKVLYLLLFLSFIYTYFYVYPQQISHYFYESFGDAINFAVEKSGNSGKVYITNRVNQPYIYVLFYKRINPRIFLDSVIYANNKGYGRVKSFDRFRFGFNNINLRDNPVFVFHKTEERLFINTGYNNIQTFKQYGVALKK